MGVRVVIFGIGSIGKLLKDNVKGGVEIVAFLADDNITDIDGIPVVPVKDIINLKYDYVVVAIGNSIKGIDVLKKFGVSENRIVGYAYTGIPYKDNVFQNKLNEDIESIIKDTRIPDLFNLPRKKMYISCTNLVDYVDFVQNDYVREQTLRYLAREINEHDIDGCVIEVGVSAGRFAMLINRLFSNRKLYLFDTFNGLKESDYLHAISLGWGERIYALNDCVVSADDVLKNMPHKEQCEVIKGYFPDSYNIDEKIAFASIDIDFYESTKKGLEAIYPHLSEGGYIMVHDYNNIAFYECHNAVYDFCKQTNARYVPIPDVSGTVVITK